MRIGPIIGAGIGGFVYQEAGPVVLYAGASALAVGGAIAAWIALSPAALSRSSAEVPEVEAGAQPEPGLVP